MRISNVGRGLLELPNTNTRIFSWIANQEEPRLACCSMQSKRFVFHAGTWLADGCFAMAVSVAVAIAFAVTIGFDRMPIAFDFWDLVL